MYIYEQRGGYKTEADRPLYVVRRLTGEQSFDEPADGGSSVEDSDVIIRVTAHAARSQFSPAMWTTSNGSVSRLKLTDHGAVTNATEPAPRALSHSSTRSARSVTIRA